MSLTFIHFTTESSDWLEVRDGDSATANLIGSRISGRADISRRKFSTGNSMTLIFNTDHIMTNKGFEVQVDRGGEYYVL